MAERFGISPEQPDDGEREKWLKIVHNIKRDHQVSMEDARRIAREMYRKEKKREKDQENS